MASAQAEMERAPSFLAAIRWVSLLPISEFKSHSRLMSALARASIRASLQTPCTQNMYGAEQGRLRNWRASRAFLLPFDGSHCNLSVRPSPILARCVVLSGRASAHSSERAALRTCMLHSVSARAEMESAPSFLAAIQWVLMRTIRESKSHPRSMRVLAAVHHF
jgi:hypothetical protein